MSMFPLGTSQTCANKGALSVKSIQRSTSLRSAKMVGTQNVPTEGQAFGRLQKVSSVSSGAIRTGESGNRNGTL